MKYQPWSIGLICANGISALNGEPSLVPTSQHPLGWAHATAIFAVPACLCQKMSASLMREMSRGKSRAWEHKFTKHHMGLSENRVYSQ